MGEPLYNVDILRLASAIPHLAPLADAGGRAARVSPVCGSRVETAVSLDADGRVAGFGQSVHACALGQASAAVLGAGVVGQTPAGLAGAVDALALYLGGGGPVPDGWPGLAVFAAARAHRGRHGAILLPFRAAADAAHDAQAVAAGR